MNTPHTTARRHAGFTLIECCVAMSVVGVLATTAVPSMQSMLDGQKLRNASADLVSDLRLARDAALTRGENVRITVKTAAGATCTIVHTGAAADCVCGADPAVPPSCSGDATLIRATRLPVSSRVALTTKSPSVVFNAQHGTASPTATYTVTATDGREIRQIVNLMGRIRSCSPQGGVTGQRSC